MICRWFDLWSLIRKVIERINFCFIQDKSWIVKFCLIGYLLKIIKTEQRVRRKAVLSHLTWRRRARRDAKRRKMHPVRPGCEILIANFHEVEHRESCMRNTMSQTILSVHCWSKIYDCTCSFQKTISNLFVNHTFDFESMLYVHLLEQKCLIFVEKSLLIAILHWHAPNVSLQNVTKFSRAFKYIALDVPRLLHGVCAFIRIRCLLVLYSFVRNTSPEAALSDSYKRDSRIC